jgi:hypothetical protein
MRNLHEFELAFVSGAGDSPTPPSCDCTCPDETKTKNNNGYGNGAESGPPPGNSGAHNPQLVGWNTGTKSPSKSPASNGTDR